MSIGFNETSRRERRLTVSNILDDVETQFDGYLRQQVEQQVELSTHNVGIISVNSDVSTGEFYSGLVDFVVVALFMYLSVNCVCIVILTSFCFTPSTFTRPQNPARLAKLSWAMMRA